MTTLTWCGLKAMAECVSTGGAVGQGDTKNGVCLLSDKIRIHLKVAWVPTGRKRPADRAKAVMKNWARKEQKGITQTVKSGSLDTLCCIFPGDIQVCGDAFDFVVLRHYFLSSLSK